MLKFSKIGMLLFSVVILISSCSIEKRVHRKGFHIEWRSQTNFADPIEKENIQKIKDPEQKESDDLSEKKPVFSDVSNVQVKPVQKITENPEIDFENAHEQHIYSGQEPIQSKSQKINKYKLKNKTIKPLQDSENGVVKGILFIVAALLLFGLGYLFSTILGVFGLILYLIFGIASVIYLVVGIFFIIRG